MNKKCLWHKKSFLGFTLIQMVVTVAVLAIIVGTIMYNEDPEKRIGQGRDAQRIVELDAITSAIANYQLEYHTLPSDLAIASLGIGEKRVLCSTAASLSCDGQVADCVVVDDPNFLGKHLPVLPVDPGKTATTDTGYYITRADNNVGLAIGACETYDTTKDMIKVANATLPTYEAPEVPPASCGNGILEGNEICDYDSGGATCRFNTDYYTEGVVYDEYYCNAPVGCGSGCNSCLNACTESSGHGIDPCDNPMVGC
ncbi:MAG: Prepilin-type N-terminal cleavage/methylation protein [Patescibacteria group bacterium]|nr:Prepilin-type N-terminal cleavage/methylation protein [Patescibacteria group bacterium]MDQ5970789.1 Prepilin-type N-terminal cleavage/methylation protein [Patescibacteria group bacterium]